MRCGGGAVGRRLSDGRLQQVWRRSKIGLRVLAGFLFCFCLFFLVVVFSSRSHFFFSHWSASTVPPPCSSLITLVCTLVCVCVCVCVLRVGVITALEGDAADRVPFSAPFLGWIGIPSDARDARDARDAGWPLEEGGGGGGSLIPDIFPARNDCGIDTGPITGCQGCQGCSGLGEEGGGGSWRPPRRKVEKRGGLRRKKKERRDSISFPRRRFIFSFSVLFFYHITF